MCKHCCKRLMSLKCRHCEHVRKYQPSTYFKEHLLRNCPNFQLTDAWNSDDVQKEVSIAVDKDSMKRVCYLRSSRSDV
jgi:hypothetical protein